VRCGRCGNDNNEANRFCGMCGAPLLANASSPGPASGTTAVGNAAPLRQPTAPAMPSRPTSQVAPVGLKNPEPTAADRRPAPPSPRPERAPEPSITGPSFLGLNVPPSGRSDGFRADRSPSDPHDHFHPSSNVDYLLDDDEYASKGGGGKVILFIVALALAVGFGYMHWKRGGFDWLNVAVKKAAATIPATNSTQSTPDTSANSAPASPNPPAPSPAAPVPVPTDSAPATPSSDATANNPAPSQTAPQTTTPVAPAQSAPPTTPAPSTSADTAPSTPSTRNTAPPNSSASASEPSASDQPSGQPADDEDQPAAPAKPVTRKPAAKASPPKPSAARPFDSVAEAERYIYGHGVTQDCDHGLRLLKPAAEQSNPKAMISLGALYSTGTCTPRDLPTAYRWFAMALHKQPDNQVLQNDLQKLWSQMTQPERQLAIKLSQ
jgi:hypothetical protein